MVVKLTLLAIIAGFIIDCFLGDPTGLPHPVCLIGRCIAFLEKALRRRFPRTERGAFAAGCVMTVIVVLLSAAVPFCILYLCRLVSVWLYFGVSGVMCWQIFAARCLAQEAKKVLACLAREDLVVARKQVGMLVGRDTQDLTQAQVIKAAVETVAENTTDGVVAPLFWMILGGPVAGFVYKAINTMDSMVGYRNEKYLYFGRCAAKLDDAANYIPARLSALGMILAAALSGFDGRNAAKIWKRDRRKHASPNSAQTESVCAGALHIQLGGSAHYFGKLHDKPFLGDADRPAEREDISRCCRLMYITSILLLAAFEMIGLSIAFIGG
ncbi:MAG: adenosylcobinamide-phosphate synthase CbiB [Candidatus Limiplasma sp.]|nr:adenosylcobinamide-phosphate synthase CbiB [Candidatus Limiplasma sp.]